MRSSFFWHALLILLAGACGLSFMLALAKRDGLAYSSDYSFYIETAVRLADPSYPQNLTSNPDGYNVFRFEGVDAARSIHHSIHFEPAKYALPTLYWLTGSTTALYVWYVVLSFAPVVYFASRVRRRFPDHWTIALCALYLAFPSVLYAPTNDLRPFILLTPALLFALTAFVLDRSKAWRYIALVALLLVREEGLIFALPLVAIPAVEEWQRGGWRRAVREGSPFVALWGAYALAAAVYFALMGYENMLISKLQAYMWLLALAAVAAFAVVAVLIRRAPDYAVQSILPGLYATPFLFVIVHFVLTIRTASVATTLMSPYFSIGIAAMMPLMPGLIVRLHRARAPAFFAACAAIGLCVFVGMLHPLGFRAHYAHAKARIHDAELVHKIARGESGLVMTDYDTQQAFYRVRHLFNYERLPVYQAGIAERDYPGNADVVRRLLAETDLIVVSARSGSAVAALTDGAAIPITSNDSYVVFKLPR